MEIQVSILANVNDDRREPGVITVREFSPRDRMMNALKKLALWWGASILSVLIPVFHFVTVPLFFFLGIFMAYRDYKSPGLVLSGNTTCPHCQTSIQMKKTNLQWPLVEICQSCARVVRMEKSE